jgi:hypothetical protein
VHEVGYRQFAANAALQRSKTCHHIARLRSPLPRFALSEIPGCGGTAFGSGGKDPRREGHPPAPRVTALGAILKAMNHRLLMELLRNGWTSVGDPGDPGSGCDPCACAAVRALAPEDVTLLRAATAMVRPTYRPAFERDVAALLEHGMTLADAIRLMVGIVPVKKDETHG